MEAVNEATYDAETTLDRMRQMVLDEQIMHSEYISDEQDVERFNTGAICGGHKACAVGALWISHGIKIEYSEVSWGIAAHLPSIAGYERPYFMRLHPELPSIAGYERPYFMRLHPELKRAYNALNEAAMEKLRSIARAGGFTGDDDLYGWEHGITGSIASNGALETLFEGGYVDGEPYNGLLEVIDRAKEILV